MPTYNLTINYTETSTNTVSDLTNTKWCFNDDLSYYLAGSTATVQINFVSNGASYTSIYFSNLSEDPAKVGYGTSSNLVYVDVWTNQAYRIISITGGTHATDSGLISWLQENAVQVPVVDLTDTEWVFNDTIDINSGFTASTSYSETPIFPYSLIFTDSNDEQHTALGCASSNGTRWNIFAYQGDIYIRQAYMGGWMEEAYRTIEITGGTDATNSNLISWLVQNATYQAPPVPTITIDLSTLSGWSSVTTGQHSLQIKAKATGYRDSALSSAVSFTKAASGYQVRVQGETIQDARFDFYDGQDNAAPLLLAVRGYTQFDQTLSVTSGYLYCEYWDSVQPYSLGTPTTGITLVSDDQDGQALYQITANGSITNMYANSCFIEGTQITLADGSKKAIEDITYDDNLLVWNFYEGKFDVAKPEWIMRPRTASRYNLVKFEDGTELGLVGSNGYHRIYNKEVGAFTHTGTDDTPNGTTTFTEHNIFVKVVSQEIIEKPVRYYNIITKGHFNLFANGILTSCRLSNKYKIENMKYIGDKLISDEEEMAYFRRIDLIKNNAPAGEIKQ